MKKLLLCCMWGIVATIMLVATSDATDLYKVTLTNQEDAAALRRAAIDPLVRISSGYLVLAGENGEARLAQSGLLYSLVESDIDRSRVVIDIKNDDSNVGLYPLVYEADGMRLYRVNVSLVESSYEPLGLASLQTKNIPILFPTPPTLNNDQLDFDLDSVITLVRQDSIQSYSTQLESFGCRLAGYGISYAVRDWLMSKMTEFGYDSVVSQEFSASVEGNIKRCHNVIAYKIGTLYPRHHIVIGAHRDAVAGSPGADDNGSGTCGVLELARVFQEIDTKMTIVFVLFDAEEQPPLMQGSWYYAQDASARGDSIYFMVNMDMIGHYENENDVRVYHDPFDSTYHNVFASLADTLEGLNLTAHVVDHPMYWDDGPFYQFGYGVLMIHEYIWSTVYHSANDSTVNLNYDYITRVLRTLLGTVLICDAAYEVAPRLWLDPKPFDPPLIYPDQDTVITISMLEYAGEQLVPSSAELHYSLDGTTYESVPLVSNKDGMYGGVLPGQDCYNIIRYYFSAEGMISGQWYYPDTSKPLQLVIATRSEVTFSDNFEFDLGWTVDSGAVWGNWTRERPSGYQSYPIRDYDNSGSCYQTGVGYRHDVDNGKTILMSPVIDLNVSTATLEYARFFDNTGDGDPYNDIFNIFLSPNGGQSWGLIDTLGPIKNVDTKWGYSWFMISEMVPWATAVQMRFEVSDYGEDSNVEAAIDAFKITEYTCDPLILTEQLPEGEEGEPFTQQLIVVGGEGDLTFNDLYNDLTGTGLILSTTGLLSGTPTSGGEISFTAFVEDTIGASDELILSLMIHALLICGDIDGSGGPGVDISDLVYLVDYMFNWGPAPPAMEAADVDGSGGIDISDLVYMVDYMFMNGPPPVACPSP